MNARVIAKLDRCRIIVRVGIGFDNVDLAAAGKRGIYVCDVPDYGTNDVADHAIALLLALSRKIFSYDALDIIWKFSGGTPRVINTIADWCLYLGYSRLKEIIDENTASKAVKDLGYPPTDE